MDSAAHIEVVDHTGDVGVDVSGPSAEAVWSGVAQALWTVLTDAPESVRPLEPRALEVEGFDRIDLLVAFGNELLYLFDGEGFLGARFEPATWSDRALRGTVWGEPFDPDRHPIARPMKAVTHHQARFEPAGDAWVARVIFDL